MGAGIICCRLIFDRIKFKKPIKSACLQSSVAADLREEGESQSV